MFVSIVIPCFNGGHTVRRVLTAIDRACLPNAEVIIVDDCSSDGTQGWLKLKRSPLQSKVIFHTQHQGKAAALRTGVASATGDVIIIQEAAIVDGGFNYSELLEPILTNKVDVVYGSNLGNGNPNGGNPNGGNPNGGLLNGNKLRSNIGRGLLNRVSNMLTGMSLPDVNAACRAVRRELIDSIELKEKRAGSGSEITAKFANSKLRFLELNLSYQGSTYDNCQRATNNPAVRWKNYLKAMLAPLRNKLSQSNPKESTHHIKSYSPATEREIKKAA